MTTNTLLKLYHEATPEEKLEGLCWYNEALHFAQGMSNKYNISLDISVQVIAILSPAVKWERNKLDADVLCYAFSQGLSLDNVRVCTYSKNKEKAIRVLQGIETLNPSARKTYNFYKNILDEGKVTVDRHAVKAYKGKKSGGSEPISQKLYDKVERAYIRAADHLGIKPHQFQAVVWLVYKRKVNR